MEAPKTIEGELTELIMFRVQQKADLPVELYNPTWSAVLEVLERELPLIFEAKRPMSRNEFIKR